MYVILGFIVYDAFSGFEFFEYSAMRHFNAQCDDMEDRVLPSRSSGLVYLHPSAPDRSLRAWESWQSQLAL